MRDLVTKEIEGKAYTFSQYTTTESLKILTRLLKIIGEPLAKVMKSVSASENPLSAELNIDIIAEAIAVLSARVGEDEVVALVRKLSTEGVVCENKQISFDLHYQGELGLLFRVVSANLQVQYGNFFSDASATLGNTNKKTLQSQANP